MRSIMIIEPATAGHRMQYARRLIAAAIQRGLQTTLLTSQAALEHPSYIDLARDHKFTTALLPVCRHTRPLLQANSNVLRQLGYYLTVRAFFNHCQQRPDHILVPYLEEMDHVITALGSPFGNLNWSGIIMKTAFHFQSVGVIRPNRSSDIIKTWSFYKLLRSRGLKCLFTIDPTLPSYIGQSRKPIYYVADPHDLRGAGSRDSIRAKVGFPKDASVILAYGDFTASAERKGLDTLIAAAADTACPPNILVMIAGAQAGAVTELLQSPPAAQLRREGRLLEQPYFHSTQDEYEAFASADVVWVGYRGHYWMSGVLIQAGAAELPVVATKQGLIGWFASQHHLGPVVDVDDIPTVITAIQQLAQSQELRAIYSSAGKALANAHTTAAFSNKIYDTLIAAS